VRDVAFRDNGQSAMSMDLASNPAITGVTAETNGTNGLTLDAGTLAGNAFWDDPNVVYRLDGAVTVPVGVTLTVAAGQIIKADDAYSTLTVKGTLLAEGTAAAPIVITSIRDDSVGGDTNNNGTANPAGRGSWSMIEVQATSKGSVMDHVDVRYCGYGSPAAILLSGGELTLTNSVIESCYTDGLRILQAQPTVDGTTFRDNRQSALSMTLASNPAITAVTLQNNGTNGLTLDGGDLAGNTTWDDPDIVYRLSGAVTVPAGMTLTIVPGQIVKADDTYSTLSVRGTLRALGTTEAPIIFTSIHDDTVGSDTNNDAAATSPGRGTWSRIELLATSKGSVMDHVEVRYCGYGSDAAIVVNGGELTLTNSLLRSCYGAGLRMLQSTPTVTGVTFRDNRLAAMSMNLASHPRITGCVLENNGINGLQLDAGTLPGDTVWDNTEVVYVLGSDDVTVPAGTTLTISAGQVIKAFKDRWDWGIEVNVQGRLQVNGSPGGRVTFTSVRDDTVGGDTNNDWGATAAAPGDWYGLVFAASSTGNLLEYFTTRYGTVPVRLEGGEATLTGGVIQDASSSAIMVIDGGQVAVESSLLANGGYAGIDAYGGATVLALGNTVDGSYYGVYAHGAKTRVTLANNLITNQKWSGVTADGGPVVDMAYNDVFNPAATFGNYYGLPQQTGSHGNLSVDPLYVDRAAGDYHLQGTSPAIDAGTSDEAPLNDLELRWRHDDPQVANTGAGEFTFYDLGALEYGGLPRQVMHRPAAPVGRLVSEVTFTFRDAMDPSGFSLAEDVVAFQGPAGPITATAYRWLNPYQLQVSFAPQAAAGDYALTIGPQVPDASGRPMDQNGNGIRGEVPADQYSATWSITPPQIVSHTPHDFLGGPVLKVGFTFDRPMDQTSFSLADDIVSFTGPAGNVAATGYAWSDAQTLEVTFDAQTALGFYELVLGPNLRDVGGNLLDQDGDGSAGEDPADRYAATFTIAQITHASGSLAVDTTWGGLVLVDSSVTVPPGVTLTINPGAIIKFAPGTSLEADTMGHIAAAGTAALPVRFTSLRDDTVGGDANGDRDETVPAAGDWRGVFADGGLVQLDHCVLTYAAGNPSGSWDAWSGTVVAQNGGQLEITNCVIREGFYEGVITWGRSSQATITNSVIANCDRGVNVDGTVRLLNSTLDNNRVGVWGHGGTLDMTNTIVSHSLTEGVYNIIASTATTIRYSDVWSAQGTNYRNVAPDPTGSDGNLSVDPLLRNAAAGDYGLEYLSPAIDAADGAAAPETDQTGAPRYDDPRTANTGVPSATGKYADLGAFEFLEGATGDLDLVVTAAGGPAVAKAGDEIKVDWVVRNDGSGVAAGVWHDTVYLSTDNVWSLDDTPLGAPIHSGDVGPNQSYQASVEVRLPTVLPGDYYLLVRTNSDQALFEGTNWSNNTTAAVAAITVTLDLPELQLDTPLSAQFSRRGESHYYRFAPPAGRMAEISLDSTAPSGSFELYARAWSIATRAEYDARSAASLSAEQKLVLRYPGGQDYYLLVYAAADTASSNAYTLRATSSDFQIREVTPNIGGNTGPVTITLDGAAFTRITQVTLISSDEQVLQPTRTYFGDSSRLFATFDLNGVTPGRYDVRAVSEQSVLDVDRETGEVFQTLAVDGDTTLDDGFEVVAGGGPVLSTRLLLPAAARFGRVFPFQLEVTNSGNADLPAPVLLVRSPNGTPLSLSPDVTAGSASQVQFMVLSQRGRPTVLPPGERVMVTFYGLVTSSSSSILSVQDLAAPGTPLDWDAMESYYRASSPAETWQPTWSSFKSVVGSTWDQLHAAMRLAADELAIGRPVSFLAGQELISRLLRHAAAGEADTTEFLAFPTGMVDANPYPEIFAGVPFRPSPSAATPLACAGAAGEETPPSHDMCDAYRPTNAAALTLLNVWVNLNLAPIFAKGGVETAALFARYVNMFGQPESHPLPTDSDIVQGNSMLAGFRNSTVTQNVLKMVWDKAAELLRKRIITGTITAKDITAGEGWTPLSLESLLGPAMLDTRLSPFFENGAPFNSPYLADALFYEGLDWRDVPQLIAGGIGKTPRTDPSQNVPKKVYSPDQIFSRGSDYYGDDVRQILGDLQVRRVVDSEGLTKQVVLQSNFGVYVKDTVDFCPGALGDGFFVTKITTPMATLEANGWAHDQGFELQFAATQDDGRPLFVGDMPCPKQWACSTEPELLPPTCNVVDGGEGETGGGNVPPEGPTCHIGGDGVQTVRPEDPNDIAGPAGVGDGHWLLPATLLPYTIRFENDPQQATAPAQEVFVTNPLDPDLDWTTFELGTVVFGSQVVDVPPGRQQYATQVATTNPDGSPVVVEIQAGLDRNTGLVSWTFRSLDPDTGMPPQDPFAGFLPPNDATHRGEGFVTYTVRPKAGLASGTQITAQASIVFDVNDPLPTNTASNALDDDMPTSAVNPLAATSGTSFQVSWAGSDSSSGVATYDVYASDNAGPWTLWQDQVTAVSATYTGQVGHDYQFYSLATDNVGHRQATPAAPALTQVAANIWHNYTDACDVDGDGHVIPLDVLLIINYINAHPGSPAPPAPPAAPPPYYDVTGGANGEGDLQITPLDVLVVINYINSHPQGASAGEAYKRAVSPDSGNLAGAVLSPASGNESPGALSADTDWDTWELAAALNDIVEDIAVVWGRV
jgi:hypothetical protein